jgi:hypothetical protein
VEIIDPGETPASSPDDPIYAAARRHVAALLRHGWSVYGHTTILGPEWERRKIDEFMARHRR